MTAKLYVNTDVAITLTPGTGFVMADVFSASVTLTRAGGGESFTLTSSGGQITLGASTMTLNIPDSSGITYPGTYLIKITMVDSGGNIRGLTPDTEYLIFN